MPGFSQSVVETPLGPIPVRTFGEQGPALILTHGFFVDGRLWDLVAPRLAEEFRVVIPDLPLGAHVTPVRDRSRLTPAAVAEALTEVIRSVPGPRGLVGFDTGGAICQLALSADKGLVDALALGPCDAFEHFPPPKIRPLAWSARIPGGLRASFALLGTPALQRMPLPLAWVAKKKIDPVLVRSWAAPARTNKRILADAAALIRTMSGRELRRATESLRGWDRPALVFWAEDEFVFPKKDAHRLVALFPNGRLEWVADSRTFTCLDQPEATATLLATFFGKALAASAPTAAPGT